MGNKFIKNLTYDEKIVFFELFCRMIRSDGVIKDEEITFLKAMARRYGIQNQKLTEIIRNSVNIDYCEEARKIDNRKHALQLIKELCFLSNVDKNMSDDELDIIVDVAETLNIEEEKVVQINRWVLNNLVLARAGHFILEEYDE